MADRPLLIGLTGSIGMGKTETAKMFARLGIPVYDSDAAVHRLYEPGGAAVATIADAFPGTVKDGRVDRAALSKAVGGNEAAFKRLEGIVHPLVAAEQRKFMERVQGAEMVVQDIPLLFETGGHARMDAVVVVSAPAYVQRERVLARDGMTAEKLDHILSRQMPDVEKRAKAHFVVETDKGLDHAFAQVKAVVAALKAKL
ncbi:MAG TPA: dephospho-CoA kinase [Rhizomicrobium sp.]|nr:dephospho-CoA kinase [Rhizomicrobium sp.]